MLTSDNGRPPRGGFAALAPELFVSNLDASLTFWEELLGFEIAYERPDEKFVYLQHPDGAQLMLSQRAGVWETGEMELPFGRGVLLQVVVEEIESTLLAMSIVDYPIHTPPREVWRRHGDREGGRREMAVQDPDGYLVMLAASLGERPLTDASAG